MFQTIMQGRPDSLPHSHWLSIPKQYPSSSAKMGRSWMSLTSRSPYIGSVYKGCITSSCPPLASSNAITNCSQKSYVRALSFNVSSKANNGRAYMATSLATRLASQRMLVLAKPFQAFDTSLTSNSLCNSRKTCISFTSNGHMWPMNTSSCTARMKEACE